MLKQALENFGKAIESLKSVAFSYVRNEKYNLIFLGDTGLESREKEIMKIVVNAVDIFAYQDKQVYGIPAFSVPIAPIRYFHLDIKDKGLGWALSRCPVVRIIAPCICHKENMHDLGSRLSSYLPDLGKVVVLYTQDLSGSNYEAHRPTHRQTSISIIAPGLGNIMDETWNGELGAEIPHTVQTSSNRFCQLGRF